MWVRKIKKYSEEHGEPPLSAELTSMGFPSPSWLVKNCPDENVTTYNQFVENIGLRPRRALKKEEVSEILIDLERKLGRAISTYDLRSGYSVSGIVVTRLFGSLNKAKEELGLMQTPTRQPESFDYYRINFE